MVGKKTVTAQEVNKQFVFPTKRMVTFKIVSAHVFNIPTLVEGDGCSL